MRYTLNFLELHSCRRVQTYPKVTWKHNLLWNFKTVYAILTTFEDSVYENFSHSLWYLGHHELTIKDISKSQKCVSRYE